MTKYKISKQLRNWSFPSFYKTKYRWVLSCRLTYASHWIPNSIAEIKVYKKALSESEPAWNLLAANLPGNLKTRFVYFPGKVTVRGLGVFKADQQLQNLIDAFGRMQGAIPEAVMVVSIFSQTSSTSG